MTTLRRVAKLRRVHQLTKTTRERKRRTCFAIGAVDTDNHVNVNEDIPPTVDAVQVVVVVMLLSSFFLWQVLT
jgi:hypothetical protein